MKFMYDMCISVAGLTALQAAPTAANKIAVADILDAVDEALQAESITHDVALIRVIGILHEGLRRGIWPLSKAPAEQSEVEA